MTLNQVGEKFAQLNWLADLSAFAEGLQQNKVLVAGGEPCRNATVPQTRLRTTARASEGDIPSQRRPAEVE